MAPKLRFVALLASAFASLVVVPGVSVAQRGDSGSITGYVFDQTGSPLSGVKISAESPTQIGGKKTTYSNAEGAFRFPVLDPGRFKVKAEAPKLQTVVQDVTVGLNAPVEVNLVMEVAATKVEEVKVVEKAPVVSTTTANVKEVFDIDFVESMPHDNRDVIFQQVANYTAGAIRGGRVRGGGGGQTLYMMDGFNMLGQYPTVKASAAYEMQTAAYGAENAMASGGVVNLVTRSGSNKFEAEVNASMDGSRYQFFKQSYDPKDSSHLYVVNPMISGPIVKDKLWYSINGEFLTRKTGRDQINTLYPDIRPEFRHWYKGTAKLSWQITSRNKLQSVTNWDEYRQYNRENHSTNLGISPEAQRSTRTRNYFAGLIWESLLTDNLIFRSQVTASHVDRRFMPYSCREDPGNCLQTPSILQTQIQGFPARVRSGNAEFDERSGAYSLQAVNRVEVFFAGLMGEHHFQLQDHYLMRRDRNARVAPGDQQLEYIGEVLEAKTTYYSSDPRYESERYGWFISSWQSWRNALSLSDRWRPTRHLTIIPGMAMVTASASNDRGGTIMTATNFAPSAQIVWDATRDGRTRLSASFAQYLDAELQPIANHTNGTQVSRRCRRNAATGEYDVECTYSGGATATVGLPCGPSGRDEQGRDCSQKLRLPRTREYTIGAEREVVEGTALGVDGIYRKYTHQFERLETNRIWNESGTRFAPVGRNGQNETISDLETPEYAGRTYRGVTAHVSRREGRLKLQGSYTWSKLQGTVMDSASNNELGDRPYRDLFLDGYLGDDHRHEVKGHMTYRWTPWLATTIRYTYYSGLPYNRKFRNESSNSYDDYRARVGINPGTNINDPADDRELRLPDMQNLNAQFAFNFKPLIGHDLEAMVDVLNMLAIRTPTAVQENDGVQFGQISTYTPPLSLRLAIRYRY